MPQLFQRFRLSFLLLLSGAILIFIGIYNTLPIFQEKSNEELAIKKSTDSREHQNAQKSIIIPQRDTEIVSASPSAVIMVDVSGAVVNPGVYKLDVDSRVSQAIGAAGGISKKGDLPWIAKNLNQATRLNDGDKIFIPSLGETRPSLTTTQPSANQQPSPQVAGISTSEPGLQKAATPVPPVPSATPFSDGKISINSASATQLDTLPGVGPVTAQKIITGRPYNYLEELKEKKSVNRSTYEKIKEKIKL